MNHFFKYIRQIELVMKKDVIMASLISSGTTTFSGSTPDLKIGDIVVFFSKSLDKHYYGEVLELFATTIKVKAPKIQERGYHVEHKRVVTVLSSKEAKIYKLKQNYNA